MRNYTQSAFVWEKGMYMSPFQIPLWPVEQDWGGGGGVGWGSHKNVCVKKAKGNVAMIIIVNIK